jgi:hypothetical protein
MTDENPFTPPSAGHSWTPPPQLPDPRFGTPPAYSQAPYTQSGQPAAGFAQPTYGQPQPTYGQPQPAYGPTSHGYPIHQFKGNLGLGIAQLILACLLVVGMVLRAATAHAAIREQDRAIALGLDPRSVFTAHDGVGILFLVVLPMWIVGSLWVSRARANAVALAPQLVRRSEIWCWLGWIVPVVLWWFPKQLIDDSWRITAGQLPPTSRGRFRDTRPWWGFWMACSFFLGAADRVGFYVTAGSYPNPHPGVNPGLETVAAVLGIVAFALWVPVVLGVSRAQEELARQFAPAPWA